MLSKLRINRFYKKKTAANRRHTRFSIRNIYRYFKLFILASIIIISFLFHYQKVPAIIQKYVEKHYFDMTVSFGLKLENVYLEGQNYVTIDLLYNILQLKVGQPILSISLLDLKKRLEEVSWIKYAMIERSFPSTLYISIVERTPIALWQKSGKFYLIDETGTVIKEENLEKFSHFIVLIGEDAPIYAKCLLNTISKDQRLFKQVSHATRISERRWNIKFHNGMELKLPEENYEVAWDYVINLFHKKNLFGKSISSVDLRVPNKLYVK